MTDTRLYANAIAMRAAVSRLLRGAPMPRQRTPGGEGVMATTVIISVEGVQMIEAVDSAVALLEHGIECHRRGVLRFCPGRTFQRIVRHPRPRLADHRCSQQFSS
jgi:hypothetical protein